MNLAKRHTAGKQNSHNDFGHPFQCGGTGTAKATAIDIHRVREAWQQGDLGAAVAAFVHGFTGDPAGRWRNLPGYLQQLAQLRTFNFAVEAPEYCTRPARSGEADPLWRHPTEDEVHLIAKQVENALAAYAKAVSPVSEPWQPISMQHQAPWIADFCGVSAPRDIKRLEDVFRGQSS
jgi:hypothetical protein